MRSGVTRWIVGLGLMLCGVIAGCSTDAGVSSTGGSSVLLNVGSNQQSPTPPFPQFTVGAWVSTPSPNLHDNITIYAVIRKHPADMSGPPTAPAVGTAQVQFSSIGVKDQTVPTDGSGIAAWQTSADGTPTQPQLIAVTAVVGGQKVAQTYTFYTILPATYPFPTEPPTTPSPTK